MATENEIAAHESDAEEILPTLRDLLPERRGKKYRALAAKADSGSYPAIIRLMCNQCMGFSPGEIRDCSAPQCALWKKRGQIFRHKAVADG